MEPNSGEHFTIQKRDRVANCDAISLKKKDN
jgi:hypothetical protein